MKLGSKECEVARKKLVQGSHDTFQDTTHVSVARCSQNNHLDQLELIIEIKLMKML